MLGMMPCDKHRFWQQNRTANNAITPLTLLNPAVFSLLKIQAYT